jgi:hypothetical protein
MKVKIFENCETGGSTKPTGGMPLMEGSFYEWSKANPDIGIQSVMPAIAIDQGDAENFGVIHFTLTVLYEEAAPDARLTLDMLNALDHTMMMFQEVQSGLQPTMSAVAKSMARLAPLWKKVRRF